jgi:hypothetical protein
LLALAALAFATCTISSSLPGHYACSVDGDCPGGQVCRQANCYAPGSGPGSDGGVDAGKDAGTDAGLDAGVDAGFDAGSDGGLVDAGPDGGPDSGIADSGPADSGLPVIVCDFNSSDAGEDDGGEVDAGDGGAKVDAGFDAGPSPYSLALIANVDQWAGQNAAIQVIATLNGAPVANQEVDALALSYACQPVVESTGTTDTNGSVNFTITLLAQAPPGPYVVAAILKVGGVAVASAQQVVLVSDYTSPNSAVWSTQSAGTTLTGGVQVADNGYPVVFASPQPPTGPDYKVFALVSDVNGTAAQFGLLFRINPDNSALMFSVDFAGDGGPVLAFSDFPSGQWSPAAPVASVAMPVAIQSETVYGMLVQVQGGQMSGEIWNTLGPQPAAFQLTGTVPAGFATGSGIGFYSYGNPTPPDVQVQQLTVE